MRDRRIDLSIFESACKIGLIVNVLNNYCERVGATWNTWYVAAGLMEQSERTHAYGGSVSM